MFKNLTTETRAEYEKANKKFCKTCNQSKVIFKNFYRADKTYQVKCIPCHNKNRVNYKNNTKYIKKGYKLQNAEFIKKVVDLRGIRKKWTEISIALDIPYMSLIQLKRKNNID